MDDFLASMPTLPHYFVNGSAGFGDVLLGGYGDDLRRWIGDDDIVDTCSAAYRDGKNLGFLVNLYLGYRIGLNMAGARGPGREFSHFISDSWLKRNLGKSLATRLNHNIWNGNYVTPYFHAMTDPSRYLLGKVPQTLPRPVWALLRIPRVYLGMLIGAWWGRGGLDFMENR